MFSIHQASPQTRWQDHCSCWVSKCNKRSELSYSQFQMPVDMARRTKSLARKRLSAEKSTPMQDPGSFIISVESESHLNAIHEDNHESMRRHSHCHPCLRWQQHRERAIIPRPSGWCEHTVQPKSLQGYHSCSSCFQQI